MAKKKRTPAETLAAAIEEIGGYSATARLLGITHQAVMQWVECPVDRVRAIADASSFEDYELRPDHFRRVAA